MLGGAKTWKLPTDVQALKILFIMLDLSKLSLNSETKGKKSQQSNSHTSFQETRAYAWPIAVVARYVAVAMELPQYATLFQNAEINGMILISTDSLRHINSMTIKLQHELHGLKILSHAKQLRDRFKFILILLTTLTITILYNTMSEIFLCSIKEIVNILSQGIGTFRSVCHSHRKEHRSYKLIKRLELHSCSELASLRILLRHSRRTTCHHVSFAVSPWPCHRLLWRIASAPCTCAMPGHAR